LKNYRRDDSEKITSRTEWELYSENLRSQQKYNYIKNFDDSPDAQRMSFGLILSPWRKTTLDLVLYFENLSYTKRSLFQRGSEAERFFPDTTSREQFSISTFTSPIKNRAIGLEVNYKFRFPQETILTFLGGVRYQKDRLSTLARTEDSSYSSDNSRISHTDISYSANDKALDILMGMGVEKDFSPSIKVGVGVKGFWVREKLDRYTWSESFTISAMDDSILQNLSYFWENRVKKTTNSYKLILPIGAEIVLHKMIKARLGGGVIFGKDETETGYSTYSRDYYSHGFTLSYDDRISLDVYVEKELLPIGNWMAKVEYRF